jgi:hypothetical protein
MFRYESAVIQSVTGKAAELAMVSPIDGGMLMWKSSGGGTWN